MKKKENDLEALTNQLKLNTKNKKQQQQLYGTYSFFVIQTHTQIVVSGDEMCHYD